MSYKQVTRKAAALFFKRHAGDGEHGYPKKADRYFFITKNTVPRGYIGIDSQKEGLKIKSIFVRPEDRRNGYGSSLIKYIAMYGVSVSAEVYADNEKFFTACGMQPDLLRTCRNPERKVYTT